MLKARCPRRLPFAARQKHDWASLDRATHLRSASDALAELRARDDCRHVVCHRGSVLFEGAKDDGTLALASLGARALAGVLGDEGAPTCSFLGLCGARRAPVFVADVSSAGGAPAAARDLLDLRLHVPFLDDDEAAVALYAHGLATWQRRSGFCAVCGAKAALDLGGHARVCSACGAQAFPRQDPAMIVLVSSPDNRACLLGRQARYPPKVHSTLAGFVEVTARTREAAGRSRG